MHNVASLLSWSKKNFNVVRHRGVPMGLSQSKVKRAFIRACKRLREKSPDGQAGPIVGFTFRETDAPFSITDDYDDNGAAKDCVDAFSRLLCEELNG